MARAVIVCCVVAGVIGLGGIGYVSANGLIPDDKSAEATRKAGASLQPFVLERGANVDLAPLKAIAERAPNDAKALANLGKAELAKSNFPAARTALEQSLAVDSRQASIWSALGEAYVHSERSETAQMPAKARAAFDKALTLDPGDVRARFYNALEKDSQGQHDLAVGEWLAMLRQVPHGSHPDEAIQAAIKTSVTTNAKLIQRAMAQAIQAQPSAERAPQKQNR